MDLVPEMNLEAPYLDPLVLRIQGKGKGSPTREDVFSLLEDLVEVVTRPCKRDPAYEAMLECGTHAPEGTATDVFIDFPAVDEGRCKHDRTPLSAHMCEMEPNAFFPPLLIIGADALSIGIKYLQEHLISDMFGSRVRRLPCVPTGALTCVNLVGESQKITTRRIGGYIFPRLTRDFFPLLSSLGSSVLRPLTLGIVQEYRC